MQYKTQFQALKGALVKLTLNSKAQLSLDFLGSYTELKSS
jgi:hypothetical protein